jgi:hypothetical protein
MRGKRQFVVRRAQHRLQPHCHAQFRTHIATAGHVRGGDNGRAFADQPQSRFEPG